MNKKILLPLPMDKLIQKNLIVALENCEWKMQKTAESLGVSTKTIYNMIDRYKIRRPLRF